MITPKSINTRQSQTGSATNAKTSRPKAGHDQIYEWPVPH